MIEVQESPVTVTVPRSPAECGGPDAPEMPRVRFQIRRDRQPAEEGQRPVADEVHWPRVFPGI